MCRGGARAAGAAGETRGFGSSARVPVYVRTSRQLLTSRTTTQLPGVRVDVCAKVTETSASGERQKREVNVSSVHQTISR